jgi:hypothetical protein
MGDRVFWLRGFLWTFARAREKRLAVVSDHGVAALTRPVLRRLLAE